MMRAMKINRTVFSMAAFTLLAVLDPASADDADQFLNLKHHPIYDLQEAYGLWDASLSIGDPAGVWRVSLIAKNLTDEIYSTFSNVNFPNPGIPGDAYISLVTGDRNQDVYYQFGAPGRQIGLEFLYSF